jgi:hypothetical protein
MSVHTDEATPVTTNDPVAANNAVSPQVAIGASNQASAFDADVYNFGTAVLAPNDPVVVRPDLPPQPSWVSNRHVCPLEPCQLPGNASVSSRSFASDKALSARWNTRSSASSGPVASAATISTVKPASRRSVVRQCSMP